VLLDEKAKGLAEFLAREERENSSLEEEDSTSSTSFNDINPMGVTI
jgi:hypothetical protein